MCARGLLCVRRCGCVLVFWCSVFCISMCSGPLHVFCVCSVGVVFGGARPRAQAGAGGLPVWQWVFKERIGASGCAGCGRHGYGKGRRWGRLWRGAGSACVVFRVATEHHPTARNTGHACRWCRGRVGGVGGVAHGGEGSVGQKRGGAVWTGGGGAEPLTPGPFCACMHHRAACQVLCSALACVCSCTVQCRKPPVGARMAHPVLTIL